MPEGEQVSMDTMAVEITEIDGEGEYLTTAEGETYLVQTSDQSQLQIEGVLELVNC